MTASLTRIPAGQHVDRFGTRTPILQDIVVQSTPAGICISVSRYFPNERFIETDIDITLTNDQARKLAGYIAHHAQQLPPIPVPPQENPSDPS